MDFLLYSIFIITSTLTTNNKNKYCFIKNKLYSRVFKSSILITLLQLILFIFYFLESVHKRNF